MLLVVLLDCFVTSVPREVYTVGMYSTQEVTYELGYGTLRVRPYAVLGTTVTKRYQYLTNLCTLSVSDQLHRHRVQYSTLFTDAP